MVNFLRYCYINCSLICCIFWIFWPAEAKTITRAAGSRVILNCPDSNDNITMAAWSFKGNHLITYNSQKGKIKFNESSCLNVDLSELESQRYALIIKDAQKSHEGNYTCEMTTSSGFLDESWELIITEEKRSTKIHIIIITAAVPSVCFLILILALVILKQRKKNRPASEIRQQKEVEDIYENHLEIQRRQAYLN